MPYGKIYAERKVLDQLTQAGLLEEFERDLAVAAAEAYELEDPNEVGIGWIELMRVGHCHPQMLITMQVANPGRHEAHLFRCREALGAVIEGYRKGGASLLPPVGQVEVRPETLPATFGSF